MTRRFTVYKGGEEVTFESEMTDEEALQALKGLAERDPRKNSFAASLLDSSFRKPLSPAQNAWAHKLVLDDRAKRAKQAADEKRYKGELYLPSAPQKRDEKEQRYAGLYGAGAAEPSTDVGPHIAEMFVVAASRLRRPHVRFILPHGTLTIKPSLRKPGALAVLARAERGREVLAGRIEGSVFVSSPYGAPPWVAPVLRLVGEDPASYASAYGLESGHCCFCSRALSREESLVAGYGPVCATNYGLPWGEETTIYDEAHDVKPS